MPKPHKICSLCGLDNFKCPSVSVFSVKDKRGNSSLICELHFDEGRVVTYRDGRKRLLPGSLPDVSAGPSTDHGYSMNEPEIDDIEDIEEEEQNEEDSPLLQSSGSCWNPSSGVQASQSSFSQESEDTFASKTAAIEDETADASVGNVTGSNAVNVFLGIGIAWTMAAVYWEAQGKVFIVPVGSLGFSVTIFCIEALLAIAILMIRRTPAVGGELGGPKIFKTISAAIFVFFWVFYVAISALEAYGVINPGF